MATATRAAKRIELAKEQMFLWEGKDKIGQDDPRRNEGHE